jgi:hypothetical protein
LEIGNANWSLTVAYYSQTIGDERELCGVVTLIDDKSHAIVLGKLPFQKTDVDVPQVTQWALVDEVVRVQDGKMKTIFSGLGY